MRHLRLIGLSTLLLVTPSCGPSLDSIADPTEADMSGPVYTSSDTQGIERTMESFIARRVAGQSDTEIDLVYQPDYKYHVHAKVSNAEDQGGLVLLNFRWNKKSLAKVDWKTASVNEVLELADVAVESGNGILTFSPLCPDSGSSTPRFCKRAKLSASVYLAFAKSSKRYVTVRKRGQNIRMSPETLKSQGY